MTIEEHFADAVADIAKPHEPAPTPWRWTVSGRPGGRALARFHIYVEDSNGRKIAAVWGKDGEREATANLLVAAPALRDAVQSALLALGHVAQTTELLAARKQLREALAMLDDDQAA